MHKFYHVSQPVCIKFTQLKNLCHSCKVLSLLFLISCLMKINRTPLILHEIYYAKGQERQNKI